MCVTVGRGGGEWESDGGGGGEEGELTNEWIGRGKKGRGNPERRKRRREGEASEPRGEGAEGAGGGARRLAPPPGLPGRFPSAAAAAPGCAARALPREVARRGREGRAGAVGRGD